MERVNRTQQTVMVAEFGSLKRDLASVHKRVSSNPGVPQISGQGTTRFCAQFTPHRHHMAYLWASECPESLRCSLTARFCTQFTQHRQHIAYLWASECFIGTIPVFIQAECPLSMALNISRRAPIIDRVGVGRREVHRSQCGASCLSCPPHSLPLTTPRGGSGSRKQGWQVDNG